jgi:hypothetical protein
MTKLRVALDGEFGIEVWDGESIVATINPEFLSENGLFEEDSRESYDRGTQVVATTLSILLSGRYDHEDGSLYRVVRRLVEPGGVLDRSQLEFPAREVTK